jgi:hypothetical protein
LVIVSVPPETNQTEAQAMTSRAKEGDCLAVLVQMAIPFCQRAEREHPRTGRGRRPEIPDWVMAVLIMVATLKKRKSKRAQHRFLQERQSDLLAWMGVDRFPCHSTYSDRYRRAHELLRYAIQLQAEKEVQQGRVEATTVAIDKSTVPSRGPRWGRHHQDRGRLPRGADPEATWTYSKHHGWVQGYAYEVVVTAGKKGPLWPISASVEPASSQASGPSLEKLSQLPVATRHALADSGYDRDVLGEAVEWDDCGHRTGKRFLCPEINRRGDRKAAKARRNSPERSRHQARRRQRRDFYESPQGRRLFARRGCTIEPFNEWFKNLFELHECVWHRHLDNNRTQLLAALFAYQILLRYNRRVGRQNGQVQWILESL